MSYIKFDKSQLINLEYSLSKEYLRANDTGTYASSTIIGCNTRKYHGLLVSPVDGIDGERHVLLSSLHETVIQHDSEFNLGIHKYGGDNYFPKGHKYVRDFEIEPIPKTIYRVGGVILTKEIILVENADQVLFRYTLNDAHSQTYLRFKPFLAFRNAHSLSKANMYANTKISKVTHGLKTRLYSGYPYLFIQFSKNVEFVQVPDWYYNIEYPRELERGYEYQEDLFTPGYFELTIKKGETIVLSASTQEVTPDTLKQKFNREASKRIPKDSFINCLINSGKQFIYHRNKDTLINAGFHWFGSWGRDTFISLPGLTLALGDEKNFVSVLDTMIKKMKNGLFPNIGTENNPVFNSVDAPLWFVWSVQQYSDYINNPSKIWEKYGKALKSVLNSYIKGSSFNIKMLDNGLISAGENGKALTWMDAVVYNQPVTPRRGCPVEINALWYNAVLFCLEQAKKVKDTKFIDEWAKFPDLIKSSFVEEFWSDEKGYLADYVNGKDKDWAVRANQVIVTSLPYCPLEDNMNKSILDIVSKELLTPKGLRTLSPKNPQYEAIYEGNQPKRDAAYHQGTVWPWLLQPYCEGYLKLYKQCGIHLVENILKGFEEDMNNHGLGTISEIYDGNPPHHYKGAISQAWSVAALLYIHRLIKKYNTNIG